MAAKLACCLALLMITLPCLTSQNKILEPHHLNKRQISFGNNRNNNNNNDNNTPDVGFQTGGGNSNNNNGGGVTFGGSSGSVDDDEEDFDGFSASAADERRIQGILSNELGEPDATSTRIDVSNRLAGDRCTDPNGDRGVCRIYNRCEKFVDFVVDSLDANGGRVSRNLRNYVNAVTRRPCGFDFRFRRWTVCCSFGSRPVTTARPTTTRPTVSGCGQVPNQLRIVGGSEAQPGAWPWASVVGERRGSNGIRVVCGGSLINERTVLTAAHCNRALPGTRTIVRLGEHDVSRTNDGASPRDFNVQRLIPHENYDSNTLKNDIMLVILTRRVTYDNFIRPVCLPNHLRNRDLASFRQDPVVIGWGSTRTGGGTQNALREVRGSRVTRLAPTLVTLVVGDRERGSVKISQVHIPT